MEQEPERWLKATWDAAESDSFSTTLMLLVNNGIGVMANLTRILADLKVNIRSIATREESKDTTIITITIDVKSLDHLNFIVSRIRKDSNVLDIQRANL